MVRIHELQYPSAPAFFWHLCCLGMSVAKVAILSSSKQCLECTVLCLMSSHACFLFVGTVHNKSHCHIRSVFTVYAPACGGYSIQPASGGYSMQPACGGYSMQFAYGGYSLHPACGGYSMQFANGGYSLHPACGGYSMQPACGG